MARSNCDNCAVLCSATLPLHLRNPNRYKKANPGTRGRGNNGRSHIRNSTRGGVTATRSAAAAILGKQLAKQRCQRHKSAGRVGQEHMDYKGGCPHAVDTTSMTMADAIPVSSGSEADSGAKFSPDASETQLVLELCLADNIMAAATASGQHPGTRAPRQAPAWDAYTCSHHHPDLWQGQGQGQAHRHLVQHQRGRPAPSL